jgi:hypothetical protein
MKLTGLAFTEAMNEAEETGCRERTEGNAGGVRVERRVRPIVEMVVARFVERSKKLWQRKPSH